MDTGKTSRQMFDVIKIKLLLVISLWKVSCFILSGRPIWRLHLKPRWNVISTLGSYWAGRSPGKLARLKKRILTLKSNSLYTSGLVNKLVGAEESRSISRHQVLSRHGVLCPFILVMFQSLQPLKFGLIHAVLYNIWRTRANPMHGNQFQPLSFPVKAVIDRFNSPFIPPKCCPLLLRAGFHWSGHCHF